jgi:hypothetical protein
MGSFFAIILLASASYAATITQAYSFSTIGNSGGTGAPNCTTFGPTTIMRASGLNLGIAQANPGCGPAEDLKNVLGAGNLVTANTNVSGSGNGVNGAFSGSGSASSKAGDNLLGVNAEFSLIGTPDPNTVRGAESLAYFSEVLSTTGSTVRYTLGITGSQSFLSSVAGQPAGGEGFLYAAYRYANQSFVLPIFFGYTGASFAPYAQVLGSYQYTTGDGVTIGSSSLSVNRSFIFEIPFNPAAPDLALYLYAGAYASSNSDLDILYGGTLNILNVEAFNSQGDPVSISRSSAESTVPEPNSAFLFALLAGILPFKIRQSGQRRNQASRKDSLG